MFHYSLTWTTAGKVVFDGGKHMVNMCGPDEQTQGFSLLGGVHRGIRDVLKDF